LELVAADASTCTKCRLSERRTNVVFGTGDPAAALMFIGEGPGAEEDRQGLPFVGRSGQLLDRLLAEEMSLQRDQVRHRERREMPPPDNPRSCRRDRARGWPYLAEQLDLIRPRAVVTLGASPSG
jgi:DNA polymerase